MRFKFDSVLAEAAYAVAGHGFTEGEFGDSVVGESWNALVTVSATVLLNLGEGEVRDRYMSDIGPHHDTEFLVWIREDSQGFVDVVDFGTDIGDHRTDSNRVAKLFEQAESDQEQEMEDNPA